LDDPAGAGRPDAASFESTIEKPDQPESAAARESERHPAGKRPV
jgi:hypothetical protein